MTTGQNPAEINWSSKLPNSISGWQKSEDKEFNRENLYAYIDGGAELYLSYGFRRLYNRTYTCPDQPDLIVEIFDMGSASNAFGVFAHTRESIDSTFGQGSQYIAGSLLFWKDHYFISLLGSPETDSSRQVLFKIARQIDDTIKHKGSLPEVLTILPTDGLIQSSVRYFHHYVWLNTYYYIADQNILHIDQNCEAMLAQYKQGESGSALLLVIKYPAEEKAINAERSFVDSYLPEVGVDMTIQVEDKSWISYNRHQTILSIVFNSKSRSIANYLQTEVEHKIKSTSILK
jgi:hypothetical protein